MNCCYARDIVSGLASLVQGMKVTMTTMLTGGETVRWPREPAPLPRRFRGHIQLEMEAETGQPRCIACGACSRACPSGCITVSGAKPAGARRKMATCFRLDFSRCSLCGLCVESCPKQAIVFSRDYALVASSRATVDAMDLLAALHGGEGA